MHKHNRVRVVLAAAAFAAVATATWAAAADTDSSWIAAPPSIQKQADIDTLPYTLYGNIDCMADGQGNCTVFTQYAASQGATVQWGNKYYPVYSYIDGRNHFMAIPGSRAFMTYTTTPAYGAYFYFNSNFVYSARLIQNGGQTYYQVKVQPDAKLADRGGHLLAGDPASISFSQNAKWMVVAVPNLTVLRVNLETFEVLPFAPALSYNIGLNPAPKTAISNDGRYAVVASKTGRFDLYDLNSCGPVPQSIYGPVQCQARDLANIMRKQFPDYSLINQARFLDDNNLAVYAGSAPVRARFIISAGAAAAGINYLALGDSYISGEGALAYAPGTDTADNLCHLSYLSYPYLIGAGLNFNSYNSVACSGATTDDLIDTSQFYVGQAYRKQGVTRAVWDASGQTARILASFLPGYIDQIDFVQTYQPSRLTVSIGGNDMGFSKIITKCVMPGSSNNTCYNTYEDRLELVRQINSTVFNNLVKSYSLLKAAGPPGMLVYAIGYPQIAKPGGDCAVNVHLNNDELIFAQRLIDYLDGVIEQAAARAGVYYVDTQDALGGHRLCEAGPGQVAMNGFTLGKDRPLYGLGPIGDESYHPNALGYRLLESKILTATNNLTAPMPAPDPAAAPPAESGLLILDAPRGGRPVSSARFEPDLSADLFYRQVPARVSISGSKYALAAGKPLQAQLHSDVADLGVFTTDSNGDLAANITIPADVPGGYHTLHFLGSDLTGQSIDIYKDIWVACSADDLDCDGVSDSTQACIGMPAAGIDYDNDGTDDACDAQISTPPDGGDPTTANHIQAGGSAPRADAATAASARLTPSNTNSNTNPAVLADATRSNPLPSRRPSAKSAAPNFSSYLMPGAAVILIGAAVLAVRRLF